MHVVAVLFVEKRAPILFDQSAQPQDVMTPDIIAKYDSETESEDQMVKPTNRPNTASCYW